MWLFVMVMGCGGSAYETDVDACLAAAEAWCLCSGRSNNSCAHNAESYFMDDSTDCEDFTAAVQEQYGWTDDESRDYWTCVAGQWQDACVSNTEECNPT